MLSVEEFSNFMLGNNYEGRMVTEQILNFTYPEKQKIFELLAENYKPENRFYKYEFFYDNCATRIRDIVEKTLNNNVQFIKIRNTPDSSFRDLMKPCLADKQWCRFGLDLILGLPTDKKANVYDAMFLPYKMQEAFAHAVIKDKRQLVAKTVILNPNVILLNTPNYFFSPFVLGCIILLIGLLSLLNNKLNAIFDYTFFIVLGLLGVFFILMWFATEHTATHRNMNILWAMPTHIVFIFLQNSQKKIVRYYFHFTAALSLLLIVFWPWNLQSLNAALIPVLITIAIKSLHLRLPYLK
jgi:hypothetical protein